MHVAAPQSQRRATPAPSHAPEARVILTTAFCENGPSLPRGPGGRDRGAWAPRPWALARGSGRLWGRSVLHWLPDSGPSWGRGRGVWAVSVQGVVGTPGRRACPHPALLSVRPVRCSLSAGELARAMGIPGANGQCHGSRVSWFSEPFCAFCLCYPSSGLTANWLRSPVPRSGGGERSAAGGQGLGAGSVQSLEWRPPGPPWLQAVANRIPGTVLRDARADRSPKESEGAGASFSSRGVRDCSPRAHRTPLLMDCNSMLCVTLLEEVLIFQAFVEPSILVLLSLGDSFAPS